VSSGEISGLFQQIDQWEIGEARFLQRLARVRGGRDSRELIRLFFFVGLLRATPASQRSVMYAHSRSASMSLREREGKQKKFAGER